MTGAQLSEALRDAADEVPSYDVLEGAIADGRRRRQRTVAASGLAVLAVLGMAAALTVPWLPGRDGVAQPTGVPTIPERIGPPGPFARDASSSPPGRASLIFSGGRGDVVVVGATADTYRVIDTDAEPGWNALLSPTGDRVAYSRGRDLYVVDLVRGGTRTFGPGQDSVDTFSPQAWLPDGGSLVVLATTYADDPTTQGVTKQLSTLDLQTGALDQFAEATWPIATPGFAVAVSPDGSRIAYQFSDFVTVYDRRTRDKTRLEPESAAFALAGRAAWAPDGSLALLQKTWRSSGNSSELHLELGLVDPTTGAVRATVPVAGNHSVIRLIGWSGGDPVVVGYEGPYSALDAAGQVVISGFDGTVGVYVISGAETRALVQPVEGISFIDVTEELLADPRSRSGDPPWTLPLPDLWIPLSGLLVVAGLVVGGWALGRRNRRLIGLGP